MKNIQTSKNPTTNKFPRAFCLTLVSLQLQIYVQKYSGMEITKVLDVRVWFFLL